MLREHLSVLASAAFLTALLIVLFVAFNQPGM